MTTVYDDVFGGDPYKRAMRGNLLLRMVGLTVGRVGEFRDAWVEHTLDGELRIVIYTQNGSGPVVDAQGIGLGRLRNREAIETMQANPCYLGDADDTFDNTYAAFYFRLPELIPADILEQLTMSALAEPVDTDARWRQVIERIKKGMTES